MLHVCALCLISKPLSDNASIDFHRLQATCNNASQLGSYSSEPGATACMSCANGEWAQNGATTCMKIDAGGLYPRVRGRSVCSSICALKAIACFSSQGSSFALRPEALIRLRRVRVRAPAGTCAAGSSQTCKTGQVGDDPIEFKSYSCEPCTTGKYSEGGHLPFQTSECLDCDAPPGYACGR